MLSLFPFSFVPPVADGLAYSALLKNELLGAGIEKVQDPQTADRRLQPSTPERRSLFTVRLTVCPPRASSPFHKLLLTRSISPRFPCPRSTLLERRGRLHPMMATSPRTPYPLLASRGECCVTPIASTRFFFLQMFLVICSLLIILRLVSRSHT